MLMQVESEPERLDVMRAMEVCAEQLCRQIDIVLRIDPEADTSMLRRNIRVLNKLYKAAKEAP